MTPRQFVSALQAVHFDHTFNPYVHRCAVHDHGDAPYLRSKILENLLEAACAAEVDAIWIGRDLGYRGGRRTGLALTDDVHLQLHTARWNIQAQRATSGAPVAERTAAVIWTILSQVTAPVFLWNVFPLHPHLPDDPFSNRSHNPRERVIGEEILEELIRMLRPKRLIAVGNDAHKTAARVGVESLVAQVRHPSYGGQRDFLSQVTALYALRSQSKQLSLI